MTKKLIVGNWKMHLDTHQASLHVHKLASKIKTHSDVEVILAPSMLSLQSLSLQVNHRQFSLAAQNVYWRDEGPYTGEVSATMLRGVVRYVIVGHSERRHVFHESDKEIRAKVQAVIRNGMKPILCVGETAAERSADETKHVLQDQVTGGLANVTADEIERVVIAYEPVWSIGTGNNAKPEDAHQAVAWIRSEVETLYGKAAAKSVKVLYGASVSPENASEYFGGDGIDGLLVGGASLQAEAFSAIVEAAHDAVKKNKKQEQKS